MSPEYIVKLGQDTMLLVLHVAGPTVSIFQAVTQIHEMTLTFIPKMLAVAAVLTVLLPWTLRRLMDFTINLYSSIPTIIG
jgi:flagellar biosynthetic protein FliQ